MKDNAPDIYADLAALADGNLPPERGEQVQALAAASPQLAARLAEQRRVASLLGSIDDSAPPSLQHAIEVMAGEAKPRRGRVPRSRRWSLAGVGALAGAAVIALVLALSTSTPGLPSVPQAARLALRPATVASPRESPSNRALLASSVDGIAYPYWGKRFGWKTAGARTDRLGGRMITTVFYTNSRAERIGYSIVAGDALALPSGHVVWQAGVQFRLLQSGGATVLTWRRAGHTCILTAKGVSSGTMLALAGWQRS
jgi:anti-sigma factor RsiW